MRFNTATVLNKILLAASASYYSDSCVGGAAEGLACLPVPLPHLLSLDKHRLHARADHGPAHAVGAAGLHDLAGAVVPVLPRLDVHCGQTRNRAC